MRLRHTSGRIVHLSCELIPQPVGSLPSLIDRLDTYGAVRARLGIEALGVTFWLPPTLAAALAVESRARTRLRAELDARRLEVVTLSGAPFAEGGGELAPRAASSGGEAGSLAGRAGEVGPLPGAGEVGHLPGNGEVGPLPGNGGDELAPEPAWTQPARREYTLDLARILLDLLDEDAVRGSVSTIGLGPRSGWAEAEEKAATGILRRLSAGLADLAWQNGRAIRVGFQPAPGAVLDSPEQTVAGLTRTDKDRLGVCLDLGHAARTWPDPAAGVETITDAGLAVVEVRLTAAPGASPGQWRSGLRQLFGGGVPLTETITLVGRVPEPPVEQLTADVAYVLAELAAVGLTPEIEPCAAH